MVLFLFVPLISPMMDIFLPLNETRPRQQLLNVNYVFFDSRNYFFCVYLQLSWAAIVVSISIVTVDSLLMLIVHHNSGLFIVCGWILFTQYNYITYNYVYSLPLKHISTFLIRCTIIIILQMLKFFRCLLQWITKVLEHPNTNLLLLW